MKWCARHPLLLVAVLLLGPGFAAAYPLPFLLIALLVGAGFGLYWLVVLLDRHSREEIRLRQWREYEQRCVAWRADVEDYLWRIGDPRGTWGLPK
jgi:hypothetical protein